MKKVSALLNTPLGVMIVVGAIALVVEYLFMSSLHETIIPMLPFKLSDRAWDLIDSVTLTAAISVALYFLVFRKMYASEQRYRSIIQTSMDCFLLVDVEGRILDVNDAYCQLSGYTREELLNMRVPDVEARETPEETAQHIQEVIKNSYVRFDTQHRRKDGQLLDFEVSVVYRQDTECGHLFIFLRDITVRKQTEEKIRQLAFYDTLTQLPNRRLLNDRLGQTMTASKRSGRYGALIFLDLDNFKPLNDTHGHDVGDLLLIEVARRITRCVREMDTVARFGGDEFVVMLSELDMDKAASVAQADIVAEKIRTALAEPYVLTPWQEGDAETSVAHRCTSSLGVVLFISHEASPEDIIKWADMAMYQAKEGGRNQVRFYE